jgi:transcriptional regulator with GAF, ATPase, and Fis domain
VSGDATIPLASAREVRFQRVSVEVEDGPDRGKSVSSSGDELVVGSATGNDLVLADPSVSRIHCSITIGHGGFLLRDLGSTNGTTLGGFRVERAWLKDGASVRLGRTKLRFRCLDSEIREPLSDTTRFQNALGQSDAMRRLFAVLPRIAESESAVLLEGETGTGKGLLAEAIHAASRRAAGPLVVIDCASIPPSLVEGELFGHIKGAFTGADSSRPGAFEAAAGGTIFLDEIGELPLDLQPKLLRALEEKSIKRIGSQTTTALDVRVLAATNRDLRTEVNAGRFRADLYYRLHVVRLRLPPLRERREDIVLLGRHFYAQFSPDQPTPPDGLLERLTHQDFPGNVRELRGAVERAVLLAGTDMDQAPTFGGSPIGPAGGDEASDGEPGFDPSVAFRAAKERVIERWERQYLADLLRQAGKNVSKAARMARMDRNHLRELLRRYGLDGGA